MCVCEGGFWLTSHPAQKPGSPTRCALSLRLFSSLHLSVHTSHCFSLLPLCVMPASPMVVYMIAMLTPPPPPVSPRALPWWCLLCLSVFLSFCLSVSLSISLFFFLSFFLSVLHHLYRCLSLFLPHSSSLFIFLRLFLSLSACPGRQLLGGAGVRRRAPRGPVPAVS